jgi:hypothetical protein
MYSLCVPLSTDTCGLPRDTPAILLNSPEPEARRSGLGESKQLMRYLHTDEDGKVLKWNDEDVSEEFKAMNIMKHMYFI